MKNSVKLVFLMLSLIAFSNATTAQVIWGNYTVSPTYSTSTNLTSDLFRNGAVGIGWNAPYPSPTAKLMVNGDVDITQGIGSGNIKLVGNIYGRAGNSPTAVGNQFYLFMDDDNSAYIQSYDNGKGMLLNARTGGDLTLKVSGLTNDDINFQNPSGTVMSILNNGKVKIGSGVAEAPSGYLLSVGSGIITQKVKVCPSATAWCDYVFEKNYERNPINYVEKFVAENKHLPNVPSAQEVGENGLDVAEMDAVLLRQVEEIWLHLIDLKKENESLKSEVSALKLGMDKH